MVLTILKPRIALLCLPLVGGMTAGVRISTTSSVKSGRMFVLLNLFVCLFLSFCTETRIEIFLFGKKLQMLNVHFSEK